ncbi:RNA recognition motif (RRM) superfamily protein (macronuclear) [Tetrahymena thermophila SB210]|uniref:RNA recognition motif (RRM) superfamily protein n=1 Tax=Tetrahymena thermophila (strain SB210) TaxID=312017 RepID=I7LZT2_TETTS|nr:RNA recognition motif (RRM) superfamily protein [Tetrahymena thermophila SB210]EAR84871.1 RNA recognition motif (RRM) superfamily protein [Tetrahymena thermophila SB210]|eukprot:XP_001032534.1 RNA recognition motif (RRM) superfamily protein [Tetrahymena thermophila SB210]
MSQGEETFKSLSAALEGLKNSQSLAYFQQQNADPYNQMHKQKNTYNSNYLTQDEQNLHYLEDSPEPEHFEFQNVNDPHEQLNQMYQSRQIYKQQQQGAGFQSSQKPYYKNNYEGTQGSHRQYNNPQSYNQAAQSHTNGYQGQRVSNYNRYQGQQTGYQGQNYIPNERNFSQGAKYQGQKPPGAFNAHHQNQFNNQNSQQQGQQYHGHSNTFPQGEKSAGGIHIEGTKIFINNIEPTVSQEEIHHYFDPYGKINDLKVFHRNGQNYAYVIFEKYEDAFRATNDVSPQPNWTVSLAKSKNTVMQYQRSTLFEQDGQNPNPPYTGTSKYNNPAGNPPHFKKPFNKYQQNPNIQNQHPNPRYEKSAGTNFSQNQYESSNGEKILQNISNFNDNNANGHNNLGEVLSNHKTQINQTILVREIWVSNIDEKCKPYIREIIEDFFGGIEEVEFFDRGKDSFAFIKFFMVQTAYLAFTNKEKIAELLETDQVKLTYSDPSRRKNIIGDHEDYMRDENLSPVLYISFPYGFKVKKSVIQKIASDYGTVLNVTLKRSEDPKQTSSVLVEFQDLKDAKFAFKHMREDHDKMHPKCEFAILLNSEKFVKENNLKLKEKIKPTVLPGQAPTTTFIQQKPLARKPININENANNALSDIAGIRIQKQLQSKGRQFSPEKDAEINQKRTYNQFKQSSLNTSQDQGYNPDEQDAELLVEDDDDENFIWSGFISINKKGRCGMDAKVIQSQGQLDLDTYNLVMTTKCQLSEPLRYPPYSVLIFRPSNETEKKPFKDVKTFLNSNPNQAGVIHTKNLIIYMFPSNEQALKFYPQLKEGNILALCHNQDSIRGNLSKKEGKYDEKLQARQKAALNDSHEDDEEDNMIYDPTSILQDTSKYNGKKGQQQHRYEHDEDNQYQEENIYDPNKINMQKDDPKTDISDLIDNPSLMDSMLKSLY